ncbi:MAG TPA: oleate hydratase [Candidatus Eisenbergiella intestinipullorum]|nr:oleate hydratase [Candidatus Eisenbergiella intestinipullorum]
MTKKGTKLGTASVLLAGAGAAALAVRRSKESAQKKAQPVSGEKSTFRNTELGKNARNSKGIYYSSGNYEAFVRPEKPEGVEEKSAYIVGSGLASLAAACFLVRDGRMPGENIHILEAMDIAGGACDGINDPTRGYVMRGGREMEDHFECLWDLFRSIPSLEIPGASVLDEFYRLNKHDPNYSLCRATQKRGQDAHTDGKFNLSRKGCMEIMKLFLTKDEDLYDKTIEDVFDDEVFSSTFWLYWRTMFAFENWHSALEMKLYFQRFLHHIGGLPDFSALKFTRYNQYESLILPMQRYLEEAGVDFQFGTEVTNVLFEHRGGKKLATAIECRTNGTERGILLTEKDLVFVTNGSCTEGTIYGDQHHAPNGDAEVKTSGCWNLWKNIAKQDPAFGRPEKFCSDIAKTNWESATVTTLDDRILPYITNICKRDPRTGKVVTGGIVSCRDSAWLLSWTINRQGQFKKQDPEQVCIWLYGLFTDVPGDFVKKPMKDCTGEEITQEWLYHIGVPVEQIEELARNSAVCVPTMMPYITAFFMPRTKGDRPDVIPDGCVNFAFLGQFAQTPRDTVFTTEYSVRTAMEAVYGLLGVDRGVPEVWGSVYDIRDLLDASVKLMDGSSPLDAGLPGPLNALKKPFLHLIRGTVIEKLLADHGVVPQETPPACYSIIFPSISS